MNATPEAQSHATIAGTFDARVHLDATFDFRSDTPPGKDADIFSPSLRKAHKLLWSKALPDGRSFALEDTVPGAYLSHKSELGDFALSSDTAVPSLSRLRSIVPIWERLPELERSVFKRRIYSIGGMLIFPANRVDGKITINGAKGFHPLIRDRLDLTLECIRRHYLMESSPLGPTLARYANFFHLFESFAGYVDYFLLQDLVTPDGGGIKFMTTFQGFQRSPVPTDEYSYRTYRENATEFLTARAERISKRK